MEVGEGMARDPCAWFSPMVVGCDLEESVWAYMGMLALFAVVIARYRSGAAPVESLRSGASKRYDALWPGVWGRDRDVGHERCIGRGGRR